MTPLCAKEEDFIINQLLSMSENKLGNIYLTFEDQSSFGQSSCFTHFSLLCFKHAHTYTHTHTHSHTHTHVHTHTLSLSFPICMHCNRGRRGCSRISSQELKRAIGRRADSFFPISRFIWQHRTRWMRLLLQLRLKLRLRVCWSYANARATTTVMAVSVTTATTSFVTTASMRVCHQL